MMSLRVDADTKGGGTDTSLWWELYKLRISTHQNEKCEMNIIHPKCHKCAVEDENMMKMKMNLTTAVMLRQKVFHFPFIRIIVLRGS